MVMSIHEQYVKKLTPEDKMLLTLREELYGGSWEKMTTDLNDRIKGRPYIHVMVERIKDDLKRIKKLQEYEKKNSVNLLDCIPN